LLELAPDDINYNIFDYFILCELYTMRIDILLTWSKIVALLVLAGAIFLDVKTGTGATAFMFCLPFVVVLITGKQFVDYKKEK